MHDYGEFYESYHSHNCLILPEKDVLDVDIVGTGRCARFKRWWHDLFLLSYSCDRSRGFYTSYNSLRMDRFKQFRKYPHRIHPMSKFRDFWDCMILHVFVMNKILVRFTSSLFYDDLPKYLFYFGAFFEFIIIVDLYVNVKTGFINQNTRRVVLGTKESLVNFCSKKLFLHVASAIPIHWFLFLRYGHNISCGLCKSNRFTCILRIISVFGVFRIIETSTYWCRKQNSVLKKYFFRFLRIFTLTGITTVQLYELIEVLNLLVFIQMKSVPLTLTSVKLVLKYGYDRGFPNYLFMGVELGHVVKLFVYFPYIDYDNIENFYLSTLPALIAYVLTYVFYGWSFIECFELITALTFTSAQNVKYKRKAMNLLACNQLSSSLSDKITDYFKFKANIIRVTESRNGLYKSLPEILKNEIKQNCYLKIMMRLPLFTQWPVPVLQHLVEMLERKVYLKNDMVAIAMLPGQGLMIVHDGVLAVYSKLYKELGHLIDGDHFGELSLVTDREVCSSYVIAVTDCTILFLNKMDFRLYMKDHPQLFYSFKVDVKARKGRLTSFDTAAGSSATALL